MGKRGEQRPPEGPTDEDAPSRGGDGVRKPFPVHEHVGRRLKEMFDEVTVQPIPDKFVKLLEALERRQSDQPPPAPDVAKPALSKTKPKRKPRKSK